MSSELTERERLRWEIIKECELPPDALSESQLDEVMTRMAPFFEKDVEPTKEDWRRVARNVVTFTGIYKRAGISHEVLNSLARKYIMAAREQRESGRAAGERLATVAPLSAEELVKTPSPRDGKDG